MQLCIFKGVFFLVGENGGGGGRMVTTVIVDKRNVLNCLFNMDDWSCVYQKNWFVSFTVLDRVVFLLSFGNLLTEC